MAGEESRCVQTDSGFAFTNRFSDSKKDKTPRFEQTAAGLNIRHKLIRPYTQGHNVKAERGHREDRKRFYDTRRFFPPRFGHTARHAPKSLQQLPDASLGRLCPKEKPLLSTLTVLDVYRVCS